MVLRDDQWERIAPLVPGKVGDPGRSAADNRLLLEAVLWIVRVGAPLAHPLDVHIFIDFGQLCSWKPDSRFHDFGHPFSTRTAHVKGVLGV
jgi:hypothetical protein